MKRWHWAAIVAVPLLAPLFMGGYGILYQTNLGVATQDARREVWEESKSHVHGKIQDLAKYKREYDKAESMEDKESIAEVVRVTMADLDANDVRAEGLRRFLVTVRGY